MSAKALRARYTRDFVGMDKYKRGIAWCILSSYLVQIVASIVLGAYLLSLPLTLMTSVGMAVTAVVIGTRMRGLNNIIHECSHATFSTVRSDNALIGKICAALLFNSFSDYRDEHLSHHAHLGDYEHDMDLQGIRDLKLHEPLSPRVVLRHIMTPLIGRHLPYYLGLNMKDRDGRVFQWMKYSVLAAALVFTVVFPLTGLLFVIAPFVLVYSALNYWADCLDHAGIVASADDLEASRNILAPGPIRWLFFPRNDCYHLVHHLFPHIPARYLGTSHEQLMQDDLYAARKNAAPRQRNTSIVVPAE
ncbi:MAG: fatty acid desaturase [Paracoccaceae bacterium]|nr:fatty acid desaturase [Paracoccaceae bacterium]